MRTKTFDAMEMKRRGAKQIYEITKNMTREQELAYWRERSRELRELQRVRRQLGSPPAPRP